MSLINFILNGILFLLGLVFSLAMGLIPTFLKFIRALYRDPRRPSMAVIGLGFITIVSVYGSWHTLQGRRALWDLAELTVPVRSTFTPVYARYLDSEDSTVSYRLPHYLGLWEQEIHSFRVSIPDSEYKLGVFSDLFKKYKLKSTCATMDANQFYAHDIGTVNRHVSDTRWLVNKLQEYCVLNNTIPFVTGPMDQQNVKKRSNSIAINLMKTHVSTIMQQLSEHLAMVDVLHESLSNLTLSSVRIHNHASRRYAENRKASIIQTSWRGFLTNNLHYRLDKDRIDRQGVWLQDLLSRVSVLRPQVQNFAGRLRTMAVQFEHAALLYNDLEKRLVLEGRAARYGWETSDWITELARDLADQLVDLQSGLQKFKEAKNQFDKSSISLGFE